MRQANISIVLHLGVCYINCDYKLGHSYPHLARHETQPSVGWHTASCTELNKHIFTVPSPIRLDFDRHNAVSEHHQLGISRNITK